MEQLDANRTIHNEWLRAFYEWGIVGLGLIFAIAVALPGMLIQHYRRGSSRAAASAVFSFLPAFLVAFSTENVLAGAGNAVMVSLCLVIALLWMPTVRVRRPTVSEYAYA